MNEWLFSKSVLPKAPSWFMVFCAVILYHVLLNTDPYHLVAALIIVPLAIGAYFNIKHEVGVLLGTIYLGAVLLFATLSGYH